jgi:hypothetical protein
MLQKREQAPKCGSNEEEKKEDAEIWQFHYDVCGLYWSPSFVRAVILRWPWWGRLVARLGKRKIPADCWSQKKPLRNSNRRLNDALRLLLEKYCTRIRDRRKNFRTFV